MAGARAPRSVVATAVLAAVLTVAALVTVVALREYRERAASRLPPPAATPSTTGCGDGSCQVLAMDNAGGTTIELLANQSGGAGRLRIGGYASKTVMETTVTSMGVVLSTRSLDCVDGPVAACLVSGPGAGGTLGEVFVARGQAWRAMEQQFLSDAGYLALSNVSGNASPEVVVVRHLCESSTAAEVCQRQPVYAQVFDLRSREVGCTLYYERAALLPGWPAVRLSGTELRACP